MMEVLKYGERASKNGFILISGPGNDLAGVTGQIAAGAVLTIFTTGRGTPCGFAGPTFRLSSNTALAKKKLAGSITMRADCSGLIQQRSPS